MIMDLTMECVVWFLFLRECVYFLLEEEEEAAEAEEEDAEETEAEEEAGCDGLFALLLLLVAGTR